jgi:hypothetical protein
MVMITLNPRLAKRLIAVSEPKKDYPRKKETNDYLEDEIKQGRWNNTDPLWITPNYLVNGLLFSILDFKSPTLKPFIMYNGHHRLEKAVEHNLPVRAYIRYTPGNPNMPSREELEFEFDG